MNIKYPEESDAMIKEYLPLTKQLQERNLEERGDFMDRQRELAETYEPVIASNQMIDEEFAKDFVPTKNEFNGIKKHF